jgi:hypothetical protein
MLTNIAGIFFISFYKDLKGEMITFWFTRKTGKVAGILLIWLLLVFFSCRKKLSEVPWSMSLFYNGVVGVCLCIIKFVFHFLDGNGGLPLFTCWSQVGVGALAGIVDVVAMTSCLIELHRDGQPKLLNLVGSMSMFYAFAAEYFIFANLVR